MSLEVGDRRLEFAVGAQVGAEPVVFGVELEQRLGVVDRRFDLGSAADDPRVREQSLDVVRSEVRDRTGVEARERVADAVPFGVDHAPAHPGLEDGAA